MQTFVVFLLCGTSKLKASLVTLNRWSLLIALCTFLNEHIIIYLLGLMVVVTFVIFILKEGTSSILDNKLLKINSIVVILLRNKVDYPLKLKQLIYIDCL